jgi:hypothetical protein
MPQKRKYAFYSNAGLVLKFELVRESVMTVISAAVLGSIMGRRTTATLAEK